MFIEFLLDFLFLLGTAGYDACDADKEDDEYHDDCEASMIMNVSYNGWENFLTI
jgi:hypothetical protein